MEYGGNMVKKIVIEKLAALEHEQWKEWATTLMEKETLSDERCERWTGLMCPYDERSEEMKEFDREYVYKVIDVLREHGIHV